MILDNASNKPSAHLSSRGWSEWSIESSHTIKKQLVGTIVTAVFYGLVVSLVIHTLQPLIFHSKARTYSNRMRWFLIIYTVSMFLLSTGAFAQTAAFVVHIVCSGEPPQPHTVFEGNNSYMLPLTMWGADSMMIWRCIILHANASRTRRVIVHSSLCGLSLVSVASGILYYVLPTLSPFSDGSTQPFTTMITISVTIFVNIIFTSMIAFRLLHHQKSIRRVLGPEYGSPYLSLVVILVESCAGIVITGIIYVILFAADQKDGAIIPMLLLPQVCVISPLFIVYAVGKGKAIHKAPSPAGDSTHTQRRASNISQSIAFRDPEMCSLPLPEHNLQINSPGGEGPRRRLSP